ncbi:hypothetical protein BO71DRAFT_399946 [Aspergillus ellipticus CBS 707.79]|uniref:Uncharacterized protein n=1 Tax=Aspergillus ellipticus CBS 707.79 TaxID=1448320 RepID=A0A319DFZ6_9EURO|nr:hypothetical protein BO71DRAFT_399946 [Aspergillus ellipticus CBS 707.79]
MLLLLLLLLAGVQKRGLKFIIWSVTASGFQGALSLLQVPGQDQHIEANRPVIHLSIAGGSVPLQERGPVRTDRILDDFNFPCPVSQEEGGTALQKRLTGRR